MKYKIDFIADKTGADILHQKVVRKMVLRKEDSIL